MFPLPPRGASVQVVEAERKEGACPFLCLPGPGAGLGPMIPCHVILTTTL